MDIGVLGMGRMGAGIATRLLAANHRVVVYNRTSEKTLPLVGLGAESAATIEEVVAALPTPRTVWLYLPSGQVTSECISALAELLSPGDTVLDGGNSRFSDTVAAAARLSQKGIRFLDVGTSGGIAGKDAGYCLMIGGAPDAYQEHRPLWEAVAQEDGYRRVGPAGAGHYVKMVHNAIEYGMMQSYAEGMNLLTQSQFSDELDLGEITAVWQRGSIIRSFLGELLEEAMREDASLAQIGSRVDDNSEGRWAVEEALQRGVPVPAIAAALFSRYDSRQEHSYAHRVLAILRKKFGGHAVAEANKQ